MVTNNQRENKKRRDHTYKINDKVSKTKPGILRKVVPKREGPYTVTKTYDNGTIGIRLGAVYERINICRVTPYHEKKEQPKS